ncbi:hypothetical protein LOC67_17805 [Stieleria sp. JC731]|uniref:hypothetical protein n=1 Tax=Pirellulaceae TaxID=2691357 RepID=UPI001E58BF1C|nr:hypothetical protein [Stieleria sp. JC731]MCC9602408.1 hypothetical protein [Stieleria sp. JC731]
MNPLELFRRNQKVMMTGLILLAMFAFVVLPAVSQYMRSSGPGMTDPVVAEFEGISLTSSRVATFTRNHYATIQFLRKLAQLTLARGGTPTIFSVDPQSQQIQSVGIEQSPSEDFSIRTLQFSSLAQEKGLELDDTSIRSWLDQFTSGLVTERERYALLRRETNNQMGEYQLLDMLRKQLLAQLYFQAANASVSAGGMPILSPLDHWTNFLKLNQQATINTYGVLVNDFIEKTDENPSETDIQAVYEAGKDVFPNDLSPEPGFRRRESASFEYLLAELQSFRDSEAKKLTDEEIAAEYERRKAGGAFVLPPDVILEPTVDEPAAENAAEAPMESKPATEEASESTSTTEPATPPAAEPAAATEPAMTEETDEPATEENDAELEQRMNQIESFQKELQSAEKLDADPAQSGEETAEPGETAEPSTEPEPASDPPAEESTEEPAEEDQSQNASDRAVRLVAMQADASTESTSEETTATESAENTPAEGDGAPAEEAATEEPRYQPLEDVREQLVESMVEEPARIARDAALAKARGVMKKYFNERALNDGDTTREPPARPNLESLAAELGLTYRKIGPHTIVSLRNEPINDSVDESTALTRQAIPFGIMMFGLGEQVIKQPLFRPIDTVDLGAERHYLTWKTEEKEGFVPELEEIRDEVVQAIRVVEARKLAQQEADSIAKQVNDGKSLEELIPEDRKDNYYTELGPFSWYNMAGFGQFALGNVRELDSIGPRFMEAVFTSEDDEAVVAPNQAERVYYVIRRQNLLPASSDLRAIFKQPGQRIMAMFMPNPEATEIQRGFYDTIDEETGFNRYQPEGF